MKQNDIAILLAAVIVGGFVSLFISQTVFVTSAKKQQTAQKVEKITAELKEPDNKVFNDTAINPTKLIQIGDQSNTTPF